MSNSYNLQEIEKESRAVFTEDGLIYVMIGVLLVIVGASFAYRPLLILVLFSWALKYPLEWLRERLTYPRVGYARFSVPPGTTRGIALFVVVAVIVLTAIAFVGDGRFQRGLPLAISALFALSFYFGMSMEGIKGADYALIVMIFLSGLAAVWLYPDWHEGTAFFATVSGLIFIVFGLLKLAQFLRKYPQPAPGDAS